MRIGDRGQVTIPQALRETMGSWQILRLSLFPTKMVFVLLLAQLQELNKWERSMQVNNLTKALMNFWPYLENEGLSC